jgi:hypothetical protein
MENNAKPIIGGKINLRALRPDNQNFGSHFTAQHHMYFKQLFTLD